MIGRRGFITGLVSLVAAPALARIDDHPSGAYLEVYDERISGRTFDLRGRRLILLDRCYFRCCRFLFDEATADVTMIHNDFASCDFEGFMKPSGFTFSNNMIGDCRGLPLLGLGYDPVTKNYMEERDQTCAATS